MSIQMRQLIMSCLIWVYTSVNPIALRKVKIVYNFGLSECNMVEQSKNPETSDQAVHI